jgi:hypothetical protein
MIIVARRALSPSIPRAQEARPYGLAGIDRSARPSKGAIVPLTVRSASPGAAG